ncbi:MAG: hypothetical protein OER95_19065 [Acidimicrobiia bacterium]|nr:hypothetical protein [Acidimicrobiia bacterium]
MGGPTFVVGNRKVDFDMGIRLTRLAAAGLVSMTVLGGTIIGGSLFADAAAGEDFSGRFSETGLGADRGYRIRGSANMNVKNHRTVVSVSIIGLDRDTTYTSHLHNGTCESGGGGHYQNDEGGLITPPNELWLSSTNDPFDGITNQKNNQAEADGSANWAARTDSETMTNALSIVVHAPGGARIACADLT